MTKIRVERILENYDPKIHFYSFPQISPIETNIKNGIINIEFASSLVVEEILDDIGFDDIGRYISLMISQWHNTKTGEKISTEELIDSNEDVDNYESVSCIIKVYTNEKYKVLYHNGFDRNIKISLIPFDMVNFKTNANTWVSTVI
jgi:hypothetical protein